MRRGFLTAGTWCLDRNITLDLWPEEDMIATVREVVPGGGGSACNFAVDLRRLDPDMPVETQGIVGADADGDFLLAVADEYGIARESLRKIEGVPTQSTSAYLSAATGRRTHVHLPGSGTKLSPEHFDFTATYARVMHLGLPGIHAIMDAPWGEDANGWVTVLRMAQEAGLKTDLELVAGSEEQIRRLALPCLPHLDTLVVNDQEIGAMAGSRTVSGGKTNVDAVREAARNVLSRGAMELVAVHFTQGAVLISRDGTEVFQPSVAIPDAERKGANGAGDAFSAGFHYGLHEGWAGQDCLRLGHATAAACLRAPDTYSSVGTVAECLGLAERWGWRSA
ncbi:carbohydrate kinase family protein [Amaricoccus macauensis]|uniref:carbohydrate kinase family protein n=1 Tax=Amaricoccus macauensis TaxID=57001 RepID=UPI003C7BD056